MKLNRFALAGLLLVVVGMPRVSQGASAASSSVINKWLLDNLKKAKLPEDNGLKIQDWAYKLVNMSEEHGNSKHEEDQDTVVAFLKSLYLSQSNEKLNAELAEYQLEPTGISRSEELNSATYFKTRLQTLSPRVRYAFALVLENNLKNSRDKVSQTVKSVAKGIISGLKFRIEKSQRQGTTTQSDTESEVEDVD